MSVPIQARSMEPFCLLLRWPACGALTQTVGFRLG